MITLLDRLLDAVARLRALYREEARRAAYTELLSQPDSPDLGPRRAWAWQAHTEPIFGDLQKAHLASAYVQWRLCSRGRELSE